MGQTTDSVEATVTSTRLFIIQNGESVVFNGQDIISARLSNAPSHPDVSTVPNAWYIRLYLTGDATDAFPPTKGIVNGREVEIPSHYDILLNEVSSPSTWRDKADPRAGGLVALSEITAMIRSCCDGGGTGDGPIPSDQTDLEAPVTMGATGLGGDWEDVTGLSVTVTSGSAVPFWSESGFSINADSGSILVEVRVVLDDGTIGGTQTIDIDNNYTQVGNASAWTGFIAEGTYTAQVQWRRTGGLGDPEMVSGYVFLQAQEGPRGPAGGINSVSGVPPIAVTGSNNAIVSHEASGVTPGSYTNADVTVDPTGHITSISNGSGGAGDVVGPASAGADNVVIFDGTTGKLVKDSGLRLDQILEESGFGDVGLIESSVGNVPFILKDVSDGDGTSVQANTGSFQINVEAKNSIEVDAGDVQLVGDEASPGNSEYYGTDSGGTKGFHPLSASAITSGAALTKADDTNVTLTLGGAPSTALLAAASITAGWTGQLAVGRGGTGLASGTSGGVLGFTASGTLASSAALTANALMIGGGAGATPSTTTTGSGVLTALGNTADGTGGFALYNAPSFLTYSGGSQVYAVTTLADVNSTTFTFPSTGFYHVQYNVTHDANATSTGIGLSLNGTAVFDFLSFLSFYRVGSTGGRQISPCFAFDQVLSAGNSFGVTNNRAIVQAYINVTTAGTILLRASASTAVANAITITNVTGFMFKMA